VHIPDKRRFEAKREALLKGGKDALTVVADFDRTLTRNRLPNGERVVSCHGVVESCSVLSQGYRDHTKELFDRYFPIEVSPHLSAEEKIPAMRRWYAENHDALTKEDFYRSDVIRAVAGSNIRLRDGTRSLIARCAMSSVPLLVFSAGIKDVIEEVIQQHYGTLPSNLHVVSNRIAWDGTGRIAGFHSPLIHMFNKDETHLAEVPWYKEASGRRNALLLGDSLGDGRMAGVEGDRHDVILKVGFLNESEAEAALLAAYSCEFDMIILRDSPMSPVLDLLSELGIPA
jgi:cytosolic 5'-nucleotidase 3